MGRRYKQKRIRLKKITVGEAVGVVEVPGVGAGGKVEEPRVGAGRIVEEPKVGAGVVSTS